ncbi:hypothetical protein SASPL_122185 [Salvia splendens]|uniref:Pectin acetylesterase n=1 Tax=Salvia splendens TaxID=180675 RepID=A0A8X8XNU8_SALSN|nr:hypothetical protein SASPL_122185 [Salvia splendens]
MWKLHCMIICLMAAFLLASSLDVTFTEVANAIQRLAVCMDGSPAGYYYSAGSGDGAKNWLLFLMVIIDLNYFFMKYLNFRLCLTFFNYIGRLMV